VLADMSELDAPVPVLFGSSEIMGTDPPLVSGQVLSLGLLGAVVAGSLLAIGRRRSSTETDTGDQGPGA
jgi:hypothetical protein